MEFAEIEGIQVISQDLGDIFPRKVIYYPASGRLRVKRLRSMHNATLFQREELYVTESHTAPVEGDVELF
jgi:chemotaxis protein CheD